jgi:hypothetical protein
MQTNAAPPDFVGRLFHAKGDACCEPGAVKLPVSALTFPEISPVARRTRLVDVDSYIHCSIIGTCLTTAELRKLIPRHAPALDRHTASDLEIHHTAVELSTSGHAAAKELNKALDTRHALVIKRFKAAADEAALGALWREALAHGDVPGAYWALLTHPLCSLALRDQAFGDVHMLSHLVGASNRADLRRLSALEQECARLKEQNALQQARLQELGAQKHEAVERAERSDAELGKLRAYCASLTSFESADELAQVRAALSSREQQLSLQTARRAELEGLLQASEQAAGALRGELGQMQADDVVVRAEVGALEQMLAQALQRKSGAATLPQLRGQCVVYVGGRPQTTAILARLMAAAGGELLVHDGGIEDRKGMLAAMVSRAQAVAFPVDCISHNAMHVAKTLATRSAIACHPLRTASIASFVELLHRLAAGEAAPASREADKFGTIPVL